MILKQQEPTKKFQCRFRKYFLKHRRVMGERSFRMTESSVPNFSINFQIFFCPLSVTIFFCVMWSKYRTLSLYFLTPDLSQVFWLISWELCLIWECFSLFFHSLVTVWNLEHPHTRPWLSPCATQKTLLNVLSELGQHLDRDSFLTLWEIKMYSNSSLYQFFKLRINFRVFAFSFFFFPT